MELRQFESFLLIIALCVLLAALTVIAMTMMKRTSTAVVQKAAACPDYWYSSNYTPCEAGSFGCCSDSRVAKIDSVGSNCGAVPCDKTTGGCCPDGVTPYTTGAECPAPSAMCYNIHNLGGLCESADFSTVDYQGTPGICKKNDYAKGCLVSWEGVTNASLDCPVTNVT
jgi:hypothetical protein